MHIAATMKKPLQNAFTKEKYTNTNNFYSVKRSTDSYFYYLDKLYVRAIAILTKLSAVFYINNNVLVLQLNISLLQHCI